MTRTDDSVAPYSSRGPSWYDGFAKPDILAPGHKMVSMTDTGSYLYSHFAQNRVAVNGTEYLSLSGTSMASAMTAGVIATVLESHQWYSWYAPQPLTPTAVKALLQYSAIPLSDSAAPVDTLS